jgi:hypothetical protein
LDSEGGQVWFASCDPAVGWYTAHGAAFPLGILHRLQWRCHERRTDRTDLEQVEQHRRPNPNAHHGGHFYRDTEREKHSTCREPREAFFMSDHRRDAKAT